MRVKKARARGDVHAVIYLLAGTFGQYFTSKKCLLFLARALIHHDLHMHSNALVYLHTRLGSLGCSCFFKLTIDVQYFVSLS